MYSLLLMTSQANLFSVPSVTRINTNMNSNMNLPTACVYGTQKSLMLEKLPAILCLGAPENVSNFSTNPSEVELLKDTVTCRSQSNISVSRLLEQNRAASRTFSKAESQVMQTKLHGEKHSVSAVHDVSSNPVAAIPGDFALPSVSRSVFEGHKLVEKYTRAPVRKCLKASKECSNCHQTHSPNWYLSKEKLPLCNACAKYQKRTGLPRPPQHWNKEVRFRRKKIVCRQHMALETCKLENISRMDMDRMECNDRFSQTSMRNLTIAKRRRREDSSEISSLWRGKETLGFDLENENNDMSMTSKQVSPRRSNLFEMEQNMRHYQNFGSWDKMTSLLNVVQIAKYEGDFVLTL
ncbi:uncharacterized protein Gasu_54540 [Galdieria sulphuraria]|uniref:GATA-type domain-containing protein n=1 Tax=Galdieria sulphuraria TaxID=130081 RepID=M2XTL7_GALSU|nr:uncharacterized protein Gasu_54540 [Galdieria sulphuraria]EME27003.1 hypothetical protein Gasu_54540 [Galdieria sulphuraria]|eukprot:XP_005703523.1 hypothetical protein Gasu_54540 [Galdieria sulphuraria]